MVLNRTLSFIVRQKKKFKQFLKPRNNCQNSPLAKPRARATANQMPMSRFFASISNMSRRHIFMTNTSASSSSTMVMSCWILSGG